MIVFEALPARHGDSLLFRYDHKGETRLWVIDGGPRGVFNDRLKPRLEELRGDDESLRVDLAMVSHIDDDHIAGMVEMTRQLVSLKDAGKPLPLDIQRFWHNGFREIVGGGDLAAIRPAAAAASLAAANDNLDEIGHKFGITSVAGQLVLASVGQGVDLLADIASLEIPLNEPVGDRITAPHSEEFEGAKITLLGPLKQRLDALKQAWADSTVAGDVTRLAGLFSDKLDVSVTNLSSISMLVEIRDRKILLTGDARGDDVVDGWKAAGRDPNKPFPIDILKMPHHGSDRNLTEEFLKLFPADHYVISADGKFGNPDLKTLTGMAETLGNRAYTVHFTNRTPTMKEALDALEKERQKPGRQFKVRFRDEEASFLDIKLD
jgi:beta-lactamase superfamily II metal-dependent hydrolase